MKYKITTELELYRIAKKTETIKLYLKDGSIIQGVSYGFTKAIDNDPEIASIDIRDKTGQLHGYGQDEIDSIEVME